MLVDRQSLGRISAIAHNTTREALRNRAFLALTAVAVAFIGFSVVLSELAVVGQGTRVILNFGFFAISLFVAVTAIVMGAVMLYKEVDKKTIYTIISKPVRRFEFVLGKYLGLMSLLGVELLALSLAWMAIIEANGGDVTLAQVNGIILIYLEAMVVCGIAVMFSAMTNPALTALFSAGFFAIGRVLYIIEEMLNATEGPLVDNPLARVGGEALVGVFPDLGVFNVSQQVLWGIDVGGLYVGQSAIYALGFTAIFLSIAVFTFERRDLV